MRFISRLFQLLVFPYVISGISISSNTTTIPSSIADDLFPKPQPLQQEVIEQHLDCKDFVEGNNQEFSSPKYPDDYPNDINCIKVISAGPGEVIRLRFLDNFHLEPDDECRYDYLEVRDGQYGYSPIINSKLCGTNPPVYLESSGRHLWLRFHSDKDINYIGFRAMYEFVTSTRSSPDLDDCSFHTKDMEMNITSDGLSPDVLKNRHDLNIGYLDCTWKIESPEKELIYLQFKSFELEKANDCTFNFVEVYGNVTELDGPDGRLYQFCSSDTKAVQSKTNIIHLRFYTTLTSQTSEPKIGFKTKLWVYYSFYRSLDKASKPVDPKVTTDQPAECNATKEFDCDDNTCVDKSLVCNFMTNCRLGLDEDKAKCKSTKVAFTMTMDLVVIAFIGCFLAAGMCSGLVLKICRKLRQDKIELEEIRANLRKSRESVGTSLKTPKSQSKDDLNTIEVVERPPKQKLTVLEPNVSTLQKSSLSSSPQDSSAESKETVIFRPASLGFRSPQHTPQPVAQTSIPYSPPPPYNPLTQSPLTPRQKKESSEEVHVIEVRDSACQTKESFTEKYLREVYFGPHHYYPPRASPRRAPLARGEAVETYESSPRRSNVRRVPKTSADILVYPKSPSSVCSVDASTGSLELVHELDEHDDKLFSEI
ncbi:unnamed protein product [Orchesella dallaii]|uniref:CUB domain-containing protein n=1 Tax=Orchesella dallaii TaxID=48710 RepID=A0ABP1PNY6_9HEXA